MVVDIDEVGETAWNDGVKKMSCVLDLFVLYGAAEIAWA